MAETLLNGGKGSNYEWGQTLQEVTVHLPLDGLRARDLSVDIQRQHLRIAPKSGSNNDCLLMGRLTQPVRCDESTWMVEDGILVIQLAKDNLRAENTGPSTEWWLGLFSGEDTIDSTAVSIGDYVTRNQLRPDQLAELDEARSRSDDAEIARARAKAAEDALDDGRRDALEKLRASFPDIPIEWGDTSGMG